METSYRGGCLCGDVRFEAVAPPQRPHSCSCGMCRRDTGAPTAAWVEFDRDAVRWTGPAGAPAVYRSSDASSRAFCARCGSSIGAIDDAPVIALLVGTFDEPGREEFRPLWHSFGDGRPGWWQLDTGPAGGD